MEMKDYNLEIGNLKQVKDNAWVNLKERFFERTSHRKQCDKIRMNNKKEFRNHRGEYIPKMSERFKLETLASN
jgi:hypothetical protein